MRTPLYLIAGLCLTFGLVSIPLVLGVESVLLPWVTGGLILLGLVTAITGYVIGILEDIRDALTDED